MKTTFRFLSGIALCCLATVATAQDWSPLTRHGKFNFNITGIDNTTNTLWADSAKVIGADSVFYLNRIVIDCDTCTAGFRLSEQPDFLLERMVKKPGGNYNFRGPGSVLLKTLAKTGDTYLFDTAANLTAQAMNFSLELVLGETDSVKEFHLSDGFIIRLSKHHGIIQWPSTPANGWYYLLAGIEGRNLGQQVPKFREIYNFNVGDIFQYSSHWMQYGIGAGGASLEKVQILAKDSTAGHYTYQVLRYFCSWPVSLIGSTGDTTHIYQYDTLAFTDSAGNPANYYPNQIIENPIDPLYCGPNTNYFRTMLDADNVFTKYVGTFNTCNGAPTFRHGTEWTPPLPYFVLVPGLVTNYVEVWKTGLGNTMHKLEIFESQEQRELVGYIKNGDTTGVIYPDDMLLQGVPGNPAGNKLMVVPNPAGETMRVTGYGILDAGCWMPDGSEGAIFRYDGKAVMNFRTGEMTDISALPGGLYIVRITHPVHGTVFSGRFVKR